MDLAETKTLVLGPFTALSLGPPAHGSGVGAGCVEIKPKSPVLWQQQIDFNKDYHHEKLHINVSLFRVNLIISSETHRDYSIIQ